MDIISHGLWTTAISKATNKKFKRPLHVWQTTFWGMFPDLLAFTVMLIWIFARFFSGGISFSEIPLEFRQASMPGVSLAGILPIFSLTWVLYTIGHSAITFFIVFGVLFLIFRRPIWELGGWFFHILIDIPLHSYKVYPTPVLWPLSGWKLDGIPWSQPWLIFLDYIFIAAIFFFLWKRNKNIKSRLSK